MKTLESDVLQICEAERKAARERLDTARNHFSTTSCLSDNFYEVCMELKNAEEYYNVCIGKLLNAYKKYCS